jgi:hypothetical protein
VAQNFKTSLLNSINTQVALNGNSDMIPVSVINNAIRSNPAVWAGILESMGMPADTPIPESVKQETLSQFINGDFAKYYAALVFPKIFSSLDLINGRIGPLGTVTFTAGNIPMSCQVSGACGANPTARINSQTVVVNYSAAQMSNTYNVSYANFNGASGTISGSATAAFSALTAANAQNVNLPMSNTAGAGSTTLGMVGQFGSIGNLVGKYSTLTTVLALPSAVMRAGYEAQGK